MSASKINLTHLPQIEAERVLFRRLFDHMGTVPPLVPINQLVAGIVEDWAEMMISGERITECYGIWGMIFTGIDWSREQNAGGAMYGANLLQFLGHVGEAIQCYGERSIPLQTLLHALIDLQPEILLLRYGSDEEGWWVEPTDHGSVVLSLIGRLSFTDDVPCFDCPQQLFEEVYGRPRDRLIDAMIRLL